MAEVTTYGSGRRRGEMELRQQPRSARGRALASQSFEELAFASVRGGWGRLYRGAAAMRTIMVWGKNRYSEERSLYGGSSSVSGTRWPHRGARCWRSKNAPMLFFLIALVLIGAGKPSFALPSTEVEQILGGVLNNLVKREEQRIGKLRTGPMAAGKVRKGAPEDLATPITEEMRPDNFMGTDPGSGVANYLEDSLEEGANILQCLDFRFVPGCFCFSFPLVYLAYEYRAPVSRYEAVRRLNSDGAFSNGHEFGNCIGPKFGPL